MMGLRTEANCNIGSKRLYYEPLRILPSTLCHSRSLGWHLQKQSIGWYRFKLVEGDAADSNQMSADVAYSRYGLTSPIGSLQ